MPRKTEKNTLNIGILTATRETTPVTGHEHWRIRYKDPLTNHDVRRRIAGTETDIRKIAQHLLDEVYHGRGYLAGKETASTLHDALAAAIRLSSTRPAPRKDMGYRAGLFEEYMRENYAYVKTWDQLKPSMLKDYHQSLVALGRSPDTIRLRVGIVIQAWRLMYGDYPNVVTPPPVVKIARQRTPQDDITCLSLQDARSLLDWLRDQKTARAIYPIELLAAVCGLRQLEAAALREQDVDHEKKLITITETDYHTPKNATSYRTIPVPQFVLDILKATQRNRKVVPLSGEIFLNKWGKPWKSNTLSQACTKFFGQAALALEKPQIAATPAKKLRATFATTISQSGVNDRVVQAYMGHAPKDILGGHYRQISPEELQAIPQAAAQLWTQTPAAQTSTETQEAAQ